MFDFRLEGQAGERVARGRPRLATTGVEKAPVDNSSPGSNTCCTLPTVKSGSRNHVERLISFRRRS